MSGAAKKQVVNKIQGWLKHTFGGCGDPEIPDAIVVSDWMEQTFGANPTLLKDLLVSLRGRLQALNPQWEFRRRASALVVPEIPDLGETVMTSLNMWDLGINPAIHALKGNSKNVYILTRVTDFLEKPYDSIDNPIKVLFGQGCRPGHAIPICGVCHREGLAKSLGAKLLAIAAVDLGLSDDEIRLIEANLMALFPLQCAFKTNGNAKLDRFDAVKMKMMEADRPRPDPIQMSFMFEAQCIEDKVIYSNHIKKLGNDFVYLFFCFESWGVREQTRRLINQTKDFINIRGPILLSFSTQTTQDNLGSTHIFAEG